MGNRHQSVAAAREPRILLIDQRGPAGEHAPCLNAAGFDDVTVIDDAAGAAAAHAVGPFDLIVLDAACGVSAFHMLHDLLAPGLARVPVVAVCDGADQLLALLQAGAADGLVKPCNDGELVARIRNRLNGHLRHAALRADVDTLTKTQDRLQLYRSATDSVIDGIFIVDEPSGVIVDTNLTASRMLGYHETTLVGTSARALGLPVDGYGQEHDHEQGHDRRRATATVRDSAAGLVCASGEVLHVELSHQVFEAEADRFAVFTARDVALRSESERRLRKLADFDPLTGLANRRQFFATLQQTLSYAAHGGLSVAVIFIDLDRFKLINDTLGHAVGDLLLQEVAARLTRCVRARDLVARLGGDEFAILMLLNNGSEDAMSVAAKVRDVVAAPCVLRGQELSATASMGLALYPEDAADPDALLQYADIAMYRAKASGRNTYRFFEPAMNAMGMERLDLEAALRRAIENQEFRLHYQPKIDTRTGKISGVEALLRWERPGTGLVPPAQFIPILEETGLIVTVGAWVVHTACQQVRSWIDEGIGAVHVAVNVSARQFFDGELRASIGQALALSGIDPGLLELELTESTLMSNVDEVVACLAEIKALGIRIAIDDFGTGYSSLAYLKRFPIDTIKIDIAFVREVISNPPDAAITLAIIQMAHGMGLRTVAEGVETAAQLDFLRRHSCDELQGYFVSRAMPADVAGRFIAAHGTAVAESDAVRPQERAVLVIDDDLDTLDSLAQVIVAAGYRVHAADSAARGFDVLASHHVDLILCDQRMPEMDGTEFFKRVKKLYPSVLRVAMSGMSDHQSLTAAINDGAIYKFLGKPMKIEALQQLLASAFAQRPVSVPAR